MTNHDASSYAGADDVLRRPKTRDLAREMREAGFREVAGILEPGAAGNQPRQLGRRNY
jgi:hypothetical protein